MTPKCLNYLLEHQRYTKPNTIPESLRRGWFIEACVSRKRIVRERWYIYLLDPETVTAKRGIEKLTPGSNSLVLQSNGNLIYVFNVLIKVKYYTKFK